MLTINYAKKTADGYILNLYADTAADITNFDSTKSFGIYGVPTTGSVITLITGTSAANYYLNEDGELEEISIGGDTPEPTTKYTITATITNGSSTGDSSIDEKGTASVTITPDSGYVLPESVTVDGATSEYNSTTGVISLSNPTKNVTIAATCGAQEQGLTPFTVGQSATAFDFGDVQNGDTNAEMQAFLDGLTYGQEEYVILLSATAGEATATLRARKVGESNYALYAYMGDTGAPLYEQGKYKGLTDGKFAFGATATIETVNDTTPPAWNGVLVGAVEAE